ncbi:methyltransferase [Halomonas sp. Bachu 37]|uniref:methyltransferase n=1 Tax=Halomonas kashgarensis TaxID=3084920 RepID=UPI0032171B40
MQAQTPVGQLLERHAEAYPSPCWVAPPVDAWLQARAKAVISADHAVLNSFRAAGKSGLTPFDSLAVDEAGQWVLFWPKALQLGQWWLEWLCRQLPPGTPFTVVGENQGGIKRVPKLLEAMGMESEKIDSARRCSLFVTRSPQTGPQAADEWIRFSANGLVLESHPGVFGHGKLDEGTQLLLDTLPRWQPTQRSRVLDMGCGDGILAATLARQGCGITAVDVNHFAVEATRRTLAANGLQGDVLASDVYSALHERRFDTIVSNPPFHQERSIDYGPAARLIRQAPQYLSRGGRLVIVANAFLPYPQVLEETFGGFETLADNRRFRVYQAFADGAV